MNVVILKHKAQVRENQFPKDLQAAYDPAVRLPGKAKGEDC